MLFHCADITDKTRESIWKYLQLILFMIIGSVKDKLDFGDAANVFEGMNDEVLQDKLKDTIQNIGEFFQNMESKIGSEQNGEAGEKPANPFEKMFGPGSSAGSEGSDPETLHNHLKSLFEGKIGKMAKEIADDIGDDLAESFKDDFGGATSTQDIFAKLMKNPQKISGLVKTVGEKLNKKMAEGDISRDDIMREASEMMKNMGNLGGGGAGGGMGNFAEMFKQMAKGMGGMPKGMEGLIPKGAKINTQVLAKMEKKQTAAQKMRERAEIKKQRAVAEKAAEFEKMKKQHQEYNRLLASSASLFSTEIPSVVPPVLLPALMDAPTATDSVKLTPAQKKRAKQKAKKAAAAASVEVTEENNIDIE
jgi:Skp family chaperone for outer membrane proteins